LKIAEEDNTYANSRALFLKFDRFGWIFRELAAGFAFCSLGGLLSPTGC